MNIILAALRLEKHPDKTFIGRIAHGFDFLGYRFGIGMLILAEAAVERFVAHANLLYEQGRMERAKVPLLGRYVRRWRTWAKAGVSDLGAECAASLPHAVADALGLVPVRGFEAA